MKSGSLCMLLVTFVVIILCIITIRADILKSGETRKIISANGESNSFANDILDVDYLSPVEVVSSETNGNHRKEDDNDLITTVTVDNTISKENSNNENPPIIITKDTTVTRKSEETEI